MKKHAGALVAAAVLLTALAGVLYRNWNLFERRLSDPRTGQNPSVSPRLAREVLPPDPDVAAIQRSVEEKDEIAQAIIDGRMTLVKAAARFRAINASRPPAWPDRLDLYPGQTDEERVCRQVIRYVESNLADRPDASAILARLESELQAHLATHRPTHGRNYPTLAPEESAD
jgi:hypothetical protein